MATKTFVSRLKIPESGNPYYNRGGGGYATAIYGSPQVKGLNILANCVGYAAARFNEIIGKGKWVYLNYPPNAENFIEFAKSQGLRVGVEPKLGAILVFQRGATLNSDDGAGHVAVVEKINPDGSIVTSESGYGCSNPFWTTTRKNDGNWSGGSSYKFRAFVYLPDGIIEESDSSVTKYPVLAKGSSGSPVKTMQQQLFKAGYLRENEIDGDFGRITLGAVLAFQFENNLEVDGVCGNKTWAKLLTYK